MTIQDAVKSGIFEKLGFKLLPYQKQWLMQPPRPPIPSKTSNMRIKILKGINPTQLIIDDIKDWQAVEAKLKDDTRQSTIMQKSRRLGFSAETMLDAMGGTEIVMALIPIEDIEATGSTVRGARREEMNMPIRAVPDPVDTTTEFPRREIQPRFQFKNVRKIRK